MTPFGWILLLASSVGMAGSTFMLRLSIDRAGGFSFSLYSFGSLLQQPLFLMGFVFYGLAVLGWFRIIATEKLSVAYPLMITITFALVTVGSMVILKEPVGVLKILGLGLIITGVVLVTQS